jgi:hypothetical protein
MAIRNQYENIYVGVSPVPDFHVFNYRVISTRDADLDNTSRNYILGTNLLHTKYARGAKTYYSEAWPLAKGKAIGNSTPPGERVKYSGYWSQWDSDPNQHEFLGSRDFSFDVWNNDILMSSTYCASPSILTPHVEFNYPAVITSPEAEYLAKVQLARRLTNSAQSMVAIVEGAKTVHLVKDTLEMFLNLVLLILKPNKRNFRRFCHEMGISPNSHGKKIWFHATLSAAEKWLAFRYGWNPFLKDIEDHALALGELMTRPQQIICSGHGTWDAPTSGSATHSGLSTSFIKLENGNETSVSFRASWLREKLQTSYITHFTCVARPKTDFDEILDTFRVGAIPSNLYEISPLSWMLDWFVPIGEALDAFTTLNSFEYLDTCRVANAYYINRLVPQKDSYPQTNTQVFTDVQDDRKPYYCAVGKWERHSMSNDYLSQEHIPLKIISSQWKRRIGWKQCLDASALLAVALKGGNGWTKLR